ncbi:hypothetical protein EV193_104167 [Herbihabitans rhizosphaerae]|uniref:DUF6973 domain-containing protein n=1 Tax=Herbihabitans rhizosphaerae TaxID=1872711 RepID=A0A4Q7KRC6_9PSEU|nr:hypothetical protein [Herbihabitans rhizosphaerae]RZS38956.1 hypothetical protein EV193_104167 [Herbihabitans rhizosphaerae]
MLTFGQTRTWRPEPLDTVEKDLKSRQDHLLTLQDELLGAATTDVWHGTAHDAAAAERNRMANDMEHLVAELSAVRTAVARASDAVVPLRHAIVEAEHLASRHGFSISDDGAIHDVNPPRDVPPDQQQQVNEERNRVKAELGDRVKRILEQAQSIDLDLDKVLTKAVHNMISDGAAATLESAARAGEHQGSLHEELLAKYKVAKDPGGMVTWPNQWPTDSWPFDVKPREITATEAQMLNGLGFGELSKFGDIYDRAQAAQSQMFDALGEGDGHRDAFRHTYWSAMLANRFGHEWAERFTTAHEGTHRPDASDTTVAMDMHNNEVGRRIAAEHPGASLDELKGHVERAVRNGEMVVVNSDGQLVHSNEVLDGKTGFAKDSRTVVPPGTSPPLPSPADPPYGPHRGPR